MLINIYRILYGGAWQAWKGLGFMGLQGVGHEWLTLALFHFINPE